MKRNKDVIEAKQVTETQPNEIKQKLVNEDKDNLKEGSVGVRKFQKATTKTQSIDLADPQTNNPITTMESSTYSCNPIRLEPNPKPLDDERGVFADKGIIRKSFQQCYRIESINSKGKAGLVNEKLQREIPKRFGMQKDYMCFPCISIRDHLAYNNSAKKQQLITTNTSLKEPIINNALRYDHSKRCC
jgi:hypothetical protein